ncbi:hypothetical protein [Moraxella porci]|uniref:hypothetical protein n=1 Tax=Moraxella porci TaxID=1288392 RepID=UPI00244A1AB0|nr:hypothetical protein [Moraxella porci]MDH2274538.1 hypothetical protein [Moraxella porci]
MPGLGDAAQKAHKAKQAYETAKLSNNTSGMQDALIGIKAAIQQGVNTLKANGKASQITGSQAKQKAQNNEITQVINANAGGPGRWDVNLNSSNLNQIPNLKYLMVYTNIHITQIVKVGLIKLRVSYL